MPPDPPVVPTWISPGPGPFGQTNVCADTFVGQISVAARTPNKLASPILSCIVVNPPYFQTVQPFGIRVQRLRTFEDQKVANEVAGQEEQHGDSGGGDDDFLPDGRTVKGGD